MSGYPWSLTPPLIESSATLNFPWTSLWVPRVPGPDLSLSLGLGFLKSTAPFIFPYHLLPCPFSSFGLGSLSFLALSVLLLLIFFPAWVCLIWCPWPNWTLAVSPDFWPGCHSCQPLPFWPLSHSTRPQFPLAALLEDQVTGPSLLPLGCLCLDVVGLALPPDP